LNIQDPITIIFIAKIKYIENILSYESECRCYMYLVEDSAFKIPKQNNSTK